MKKLLASLLAAAMALSLVACGGGSSSDPGSASGADPATSGDNTSQADSSGDGELRTVKMCLARSAEVLEDTPFWVAENLLSGGGGPEAGDDRDLRHHRLQDGGHRPGGLRCSRPLSGAAVDRAGPAHQDCLRL